MAQLLQQAIDGLTIGSIYALVALGFSLIFQTSGLLNFAHPQVLMLGGLIGYTLLTRLNWPFAAVLSATGICCGAVAILIDVALLGPMRRRRASENSLIVLTIGIGIILVSAAMLLWGPYSLPYPQSSPQPPLQMAGVALSWKSIVIWLAVLMTLAVFQYFLRRTRLGLAMRAAAVDSEAATLVGIPIRATVTASFGVSGAMAGMAGVLIGSIYYASFEMGATGVKSVCAAVIGGFGNLPGAVVGGLLLGLLESFTAVNLSAEYTDILIYGILVVFLLVRPQGLFGARRRKV
jgi:branched-chain amino acid transport system permease protein